MSVRKRMQLDQQNPQKICSQSETKLRPRPLLPCVTGGLWHRSKELRNLPMISPEVPDAREAHAGSAFGKDSGVRSPSVKRGTGERLKMNHPMESEMVKIEEVVDNSKVWRSNWESNGDARFQRLNARGVEFIAKPGKIQDLRNCIRDRVMEHLKLATGFSSAIVLTSHKEQRLVLVLTFWATETQARNNCW